MRVFIASTSAEERLALAARLAQSGSCQIVSDPAWADVVLVSPEDWARLSREGPGLMAYWDRHVRGSGRRAE